MRQYILILLSVLSSLVLKAQNNDAKPIQVVQLIGIENDTTSFSVNSYAVMYDSQTTGFEGSYAPYQTIGVIRSGNNVQLTIEPFLIVPTSEGFRYITQSVEEVPNDTTDIDDQGEFAKYYTLSYSNTIPKVFTDKLKIRDFIASQNPEFDQAIETNFEKISFLTPNFYITEGYESQITGGATWFNANQVSKIYSIDPKLYGITNRLSDYLTRTRLNPIIIDVAQEVYGEQYNLHSVLPWASTVAKHQDSYFTLIYQNNQVRVLPLISLWGNSARSFLALGEPFSDESLLNKLMIKQYGSKTKNVSEFISPDKTTRTLIQDNTIKVYDNNTNQLLLEKPFPPFNKIVMSEWALGKYVDDWSNQFKD